MVRMMGREWEMVRDDGREWGMVGREWEMVRMMVR